MYLGNIPSTSFEAVKKDRFTGLTGTGVTLSHSVSSVQDIVVWVNNVKQDYNNYTVSNTALTLGGSLVSADVVQVLYVGRTFQTVNPAADSVGSSQVADTLISGQTAETSIATDDLILLSDTSASGALKKMTRANFVSGLGLAECSFRAYQNSAQVINNATSSQINLDTEDWDTDNAFASNTFTCPSDKAGKYIVVGAVRADPSWASTDQFNVMIYRNGASNTGSMTSNSLRAGIGNSVVTAQIINMAAGDTLKLYMYHNEGGGEGLQTGQESTYMAGTRITS